jgi:hypothetical protein
VSVGVGWSKDHVSAMGAYILTIIWRLMLDKTETRRGHLGGLVEHSEGKGGESAVTILRFLCGRPRLCRLRTKELVPVAKY